MCKARPCKDDFEKQHVYEALKQLVYEALKQHFQSNRIRITSSGMLLNFELLGMMSCF